MKKNLVYIILLLFICQSAHAALGSYNPEMEDGIFDRVKFNWFKKDKKFIELVEPKIDETLKSGEHNKKPADFDEYTYYKYLQNNTITY